MPEHNGFDRATPILFFLPRFLFSSFLFFSVAGQGFLLKRRETGNWQKRWCVLTERNMEYYHSRQVRQSLMVSYGRA